MQRVDLEEGAWADYWPALVPDSERWMTALTAELALAVEEYRIAGRTVASPRLVAWHGDAGASYVYSGALHEPRPWTPALMSLRAQVEATTGLSFNSVLANLYRDGQDGMGWHADAEPEIGPTAADRWVASLSLGQPRRFVLRHRREQGRRYEFMLGDGALLAMRGTTQTHYRHALPRTRKPVGPRMNLTFRHLRSAAR